MTPEAAALAVTWHSFDLRSGRRGDPVIVDALGTLKRVVGQATNVTLNVLCYDVQKETHPLGLPTAAGEVPGWNEATLPGRTMLVALDANENILWGGMVLRRRAGTGAWVAVDAVTLEHYFERRFVGDLDLTDQDLATVAAGLIGEQDVDGLDFAIDATPTGHTAEEALFSAGSDVTIASALQRISGLEGGCEYAVELSWVDDARTRLLRTVRIAQRLGSAPALTTQWTLPGPVIDFEYVEDYSSEFGANDILRTSSGEGSERPTSQRFVDEDLLATGWARYENRDSPGSNIVDDEALDQHAASALAEMRLGLTELRVTAHLADAPRLGVDWWIGDDITVALTCARFPERVGPDGDRVAGYTRRVRTVGVEIDLDAQTLTPITQEIEGP